MNARSILAVTVVVSAMSLANGCGTIAGEAVGLFRGGQGTFVPTSPRHTNPSLLAGYADFRIGAINDETGLVPAGFFDHVNMQLQAELAEKGLVAAVGRTCLIEADVVHFETEGTVAIILGPMEEIVVKARLLDEQSGQVIAHARCVGRIDTRLNKGVEKVAEGLGKAFAAWIEANHPASTQ